MAWWASKNMFRRYFYETRETRGISRRGDQSCPTLSMLFRWGNSAWYCMVGRFDRFKLNSKTTYRFRVCESLICDTWNERNDLLAFLAVFRHCPHQFFDFFRRIGNFCCFACNQLQRIFHAQDTTANCTGEVRVDRFGLTQSIGTEDGEDDHNWSWTDDGWHGT